MTYTWLNITPNQRPHTPWALNTPPTSSPGSSALTVSPAGTLPSCHYSNHLMVSHLLFLLPQILFSRIFFWFALSLHLGVFSNVTSSYYETHSPISPTTPFHPLMLLYSSYYLKIRCICICSLSGGGAFSVLFTVASLASIAVTVISTKRSANK